MCVLVIVVAWKQSVAYHCEKVCPVITRSVGGEESLLGDTLFNVFGVSRKGSSGKEGWDKLWQHLMGSAIMICQFKKGILGKKICVVYST